MAEFLPPVPESLAETGLSFQFLADLALESSISSASVTERMRLPLLLAEEVPLDCDAICLLSILVQ